MKLSTLSRNFAALVGSNFTVQALRFLTIVLLARRLGSGFFGGYNYLVLLVGYGFTLVEFGLKNLGVREISQGRGSRQLVKHILKARLCLAGFGAAAVVGLTWTAFPQGQYFLPSLFFGMSLFVDACLVDFVVIAHERLVSQAVANVAQAFFLYVVSFFYVRGEHDFLLLSQFFLLSHIIWVGIFFVAAKPFRTLCDDQTFNKRLTHIAWAGVPFLAAQLLGSFQSSMDLLLLGQFHYERWLGDYAAALKILAVALGIINALLSAMQPRFARESHDLTSSKMRILVLDTTRMIWVFLLPTVLGSWLFGSQLITWFFGDQYLMAAHLLKPLSLAFGFFCLGLPPLHGIFVSSKTQMMVRIVVADVTVSFVVVFAVLMLGRPEWVPWAMVVAQIFYMITAWIPYGKWGFLTTDDLQILPLPALLLIIPLVVPVHISPWFKFGGAAMGYLVGLCLGKFWKKPWAHGILGGVP